MRPVSDLDEVRRALIHEALEDERAMRREERRAHELRETERRDNRARRARRIETLKTIASIGVPVMVAVALIGTVVGVCFNAEVQKREHNLCVRACGLQPLLSCENHVATCSVATEERTLP